LDITGLAAVTLLFGGGTLYLLSISPVGKALAARILGKRSLAIDEEELLREVKELRDEVDALRAADPEEVLSLRRDFEQLAERVDFAERLLAQKRDAARLSGGQ
jgi:hypothetical protein